MASVSSFDYITCILTSYLSLLLLLLLLLSCIQDDSPLYLECKRYNLKQSKARLCWCKLPPVSLFFIPLCFNSVLLSFSFTFSFSVFSLCSHSIPSFYNTSTPKCMCIEFTIKKQSNYLCVFRKFGSTTFKPVDKLAVLDGCSLHVSASKIHASCTSYTHTQIRTHTQTIVLYIQYNVHSRKERTFAQSINFNICIALYVE